MAIDPMIIDRTTGRELWTAADCANHCNISRKTWSSYLNKNLPPEAIGHLDKRTPLWDAQQVKDWHANRPGSPVPNAPTRTTK